jgi:hypothetical protein
VVLVARRTSGRALSGTDAASVVTQPKTSAGAVFALVFGLSALFSALTGLLAPLAILLGIVAIVLSVFGILMSRQPQITGKGVAIGGLVLGLLGLLISLGLIGGLLAFLSNDANRARIENRIEQVRQQISSTQPVPSR